MADNPIPGVAPNLRPCILIPHYNHARQLPDVLSGLEPLGLPVFLVDDGSAPAEYAALLAAVRHLPWVSVARETRNAGKGAAVVRGLGLARARGYTHALQVDADGQHRLADIPALLAEAGRHPGALVSGRPVFDASVPGARLHGRQISLFWSRLETCSRDIEDAMCGFRVYPVEAVLALAADGAAGAGMEFDTAILVRAHWAGIPLKFVPTAVTYPVGGVSHFRLFHDNVRISVMHTRLFFGMLARLPGRLGRRARRTARA